jgi:large subunit ribosomal protein L30
MLCEQRLMPWIKSSPPKIKRLIVVNLSIRSNPIGSDRRMAKKKQKKLQITLVKSPIGYSKRQKATLKAMGLRKLNQMVVQDDSAVMRGMIDKVSHLVTVDEA